MVTPFNHRVLPEALSVLSSLHHPSLSSLAPVHLTGQTVRPGGALTKPRQQILSNPDLFAFLCLLPPSLVSLCGPASSPGKREETPF